MVWFILIKAYAFTTKCCGHGSKIYTIWEKFTAAKKIKINIYEHGYYFLVTYTGDFTKHLPGDDFTIFCNRK